MGKQKMEADGGAHEHGAAEGGGKEEGDEFKQRLRRSTAALTAEAGEKGWKCPFVFAQMADTQFGLVQGEPEKGWAEEVDVAAKAVQSINRLRPRFVIICGDFIDAWPEDIPGQYGCSDEKVRRAQIDDFKRVMSGIEEDIPLLCVCGNHDVGNRPNSRTIDLYRQDFGEDHFAFWVGGVRCLVLNSNLYFDPSDARKEYEEQHAWFEAELKAAQEAHAVHTLVFTHIAWFLNDANEDDDVGTTSFKLPRNESVVNLPSKYFRIPLERRKPALEAMKRHGANYTFSGHWHRNGGAISDGHEQVITAALGGNL